MLVVRWTCRPWEQGASHHDGLLQALNVCEYLSPHLMGCPASVLDGSLGLPRWKVLVVAAEILPLRQLQPVRQLCVLQLPT